MTTADVQLELRPPRWARAWAVVFPALFAGFFLFVVRPQGNVWLGAFVVFVFAPALSWRLFRLAALGTADGRLVVRNHWRDRVVPRDDIAEVGVERHARAANRSVTLRLRDGGAVRLDVTETPFAGPFRGRLERQAAEVREWVKGDTR